MLGSRSLPIYRGSIITGSILFGLGLDYIFDITSIDPASLIHLHKEASWTDIVSGIVLWVFILYFMIKSCLKTSK